MQMPWEIREDQTAPLRVKMAITDHAIARFKERVDNSLPDQDIVVQMLVCLATAKPKHFRKVHKNTCLIPTARCVFVVSKNKIVTVIGRDTVGSVITTGLRQNDKT